MSDHTYVYSPVHLLWMTGSDTSLPDKIFLHKHMEILVIFGCAVRPQCFRSDMMVANWHQWSADRHIFACIVWKNQPNNEHPHFKMSSWNASVTGSVLSLYLYVLIVQIFIYRFHRGLESGAVGMDVLSRCWAEMIEARQHFWNISSNVNLPRREDLVTEVRTTRSLLLPPIARDVLTHTPHVAWQKTQSPFECHSFKDVFFLFCFALCFVFFLSKMSDRGHTLCMKSSHTCLCWTLYQRGSDFMVFCKLSPI